MIPLIRRTWNRANPLRESSDVAASRCGRRDEELGFNGYRVSVWEDQSVLEMDGGDGWTTVCTYLMPLN